MGSAAEQLEAAVLALPRGERARLAERLLASLDEDTEIDAEWAKEVEARLEAYHRGEIESVPADEVIREARRNLNTSRSQSGSSRPRARSFWKRLNSTN